MSFESNNQNSNQPPVWEGAVSGYLMVVEKRLIRPEQIIPAMSQMCLELVRNDMLDNLGELQESLRKREAIVQLIAKKFIPHELPPDLRCLDIRSAEPRNHWLMVSFGHEEIRGQFGALNVSNEVNEETLRKDTGILTADQPR